MTRLFTLFFLLLFFASCSESFKTIDPIAFNKQLADSTGIETPEELITLYYNYPLNEGTPRLTFQTEDLGDNKYEITMINDHLEDDELAAIKIVMTATRSGLHWTVLTIKENWKCWEGYGHTDWGT